MVERKSFRWVRLNPAWSGHDWRETGAHRDTCSLSSESLPLVRSIYQAWERGDWSSTEWADPDIEFVETGGPAPVSETGAAGMAEGWRGFLSTWDDLQVKVDEYRELDDDR